MGQIELFARTRGKEELVQIVKYAVKRDFRKEIVEGMNYNPDTSPLTVEIVGKLCEVFADRQAKLHSEWLRVGTFLISVEIKFALSSISCLIMFSYPRGTRDESTN